MPRAPTPPRPKPPPPQSPILRLTLAASLALGLLTTHGARPGHQVQLDAGQAATPPAEVPPLEVPVDLWVGPDEPRRRVPDKPYPTQRKPPCEPGEVVLRGGCWLETTAPPPCPSSAAEHEGRCYVPVAARTRVPTTIDAGQQE